MKKFLLAVLLLSVATLLPAQMIERQGNRYTVDGITYNTSASFRNNYLKFNNPELFNQYNKGYKLAAGGWGLLSAGVALTTASAVIRRSQPTVSCMDNRRFCWCVSYLRKYSHVGSRLSQNAPSG